MTGVETVVLETPDGQQVITSQVSGLDYKSGSPGGYLSAQFDLPRKLDASTFRDTDVLIYHRQTGEQLWGGEIVEQGRTDSGLWRISCLGKGLAELQRRTEPYMVIDSSPTVSSQKEFVGYKVKQVSRIKRKRKKPKNGTITWAESKNFKQTTGIGYGKAEHASAPNATEEEGLLFSIPKGIDVTALAEVRAEIRTPALCGQLLGAYGYRYICSLASTAWRLHGVPITVGSSFVTDRNDDWVTSLTSMTWRNRSHFGDGRNALALRILRGTNLTTGADTWAHIRELIIRTQMFAVDGSVRSGASISTDTVLAHEVFTDITVRRCPDLKIRNLATGTFAFRQLAWYEGITAKGVLDEICEADGELLWHAWGRDTDGKTVIDLDTAPTEVRYELSTRFGFDAPTPSTEYYNHCVVVGKINGVDTRHVEDRSNGARVRSFTLDLDGDFANGNAEAAATLFLDANAAPPNAGTITVVEPVLDLMTGRWVHPSQVLPGQLCRVRGVQPQPDTLNPEAKQDGVTIFRIVSNTHDVDAGASTLELDTPVLDTDRAIADLIGA